MDQQLIIKFHDAKGGTTSMSAMPGAANRFAIPADTHVELINPRTGRGPASVKASRKGQNLVIRVDDDSGLPGNATEIVLEGYYPQVGCQLAGLDDQGQYLEYMPSDRDDASSIAILVDGDSTSTALAGAPIDMTVGPGACAAPVSLAAVAGGFGGAAISPWVLGAIGLGAAAVAVGASGGGSGNGGTGSNGGTGGNGAAHVPATPVQAPTSYRDDAGAVQSENSTAALTDDSTPGLHVGALPSDATGAVLYVDGVVTPAVYDPTTGTLTPSAPLTDGSHTLGYGWSNGTGTTPSSPTMTVAVDAAPPDAPGNLKIADTDGDGKPNISGTGEPNGLVTITDPTGAKHTTTVDPTGHFELEIDLPVKSTGEWTATVTDPAGNVSPPASLTLTEPPVAQATVITAATDDVIPVTGPIAERGYTNDPTPTLTGTTKPNSEITVRDGEKILGTTLANGSGVWTFTPTASIGEGDHALTAQVVDPNGNLSITAPFVFTVDVTRPDAVERPSLHDNVAPILGQIIDGTVTNDTTPTFEGWAEAGATVVISDKTGVVGSTTVGQTGFWSFTPSTDLANGAHELKATVVDRAGNVSADTTPIKFTVDALAPTVLTLIGPVTDNQGPVTGTVRSGTTIDDAQPVFSGTAEPGATVTLKDGDTEIGQTTADSMGQWAVAPDRPLGPGNHSVTATATDPAGNSGKPSDPFSFGVLTGGAPTGTAINALVDDVGKVSYIPKNGLTNDPTPTVQGKALAGTTVTLYADDKSVLGTTVVNPQGEWSITPARMLEDGRHALTAIATDGAGRSSEPSGSFQFTVDTHAPDQAKNLKLTDNVGPITGPTSTVDPTDDATPTLTGTGEAGATITISDKGEILGTTTVGTDGTWSFTPSRALPDGSHALTTTVTDPAGNTNATPTAEIEFVVDTRKVTISIDSAYDDSVALTGPLASGAFTNDLRPTFSGKAIPGGTVKLYSGTDVIGTTVADGVTGLWTITPAANLSESAHDITATVTVATAGEGEHTSPFKLVIDATAPKEPEIRTINDDAGDKKGVVAPGAPTDDETPTLSGIAEAGATIRVLDGGKLLGTTVADKDGNWTFTSTTPWNQGSHAIKTTATDAAGNQSGESAVIVLIDSKAPDSPTIDRVVDDQGPSTGPLTSGSTTDDAQPLFSGTAEAGATVVLMDGDRVIGQTVASMSGSWTISPTVLGNGTHHITAVAVDAAGNRGAPSPQFDLQTAAGGTAKSPSITAVLDNVNDTGVNTPVDRNSVTNDSTPTVQGTVQAGSTVELFDATTNKLLGTTVANAAGQWSITASPALANGAHDLVAKATAANGDVLDPTGAYKIIVDITPPLAAKDLTLNDNVGTVTGPIAAGATTDDATPTFGGTAEPGATVTVYDMVTPLGTTTVNTDGTWQFTPKTALEDGRHSLSATVTDPAGNVGPASDALSFVVGAPSAPGVVPPVWVAIDTVMDQVGSITGTIATGSRTDDTRPLVSGHATPGGVVKLYDSVSGLVGTTTADIHTGEWSIRSAVLTPGSHDLTTTVTPAGGSESVQGGPFSLVIDVSIPLTPTLSKVTDDVGSITGAVLPDAPTDDSTPTLSGTAEAGSTVTILDNKEVIGTTTATASGTWEFTPRAPLNPGTHAITLTATDAVGLVSPPTDPAWNIVIDTSGTSLPGGGPDPLAAQTISVTKITNDTGASSTDFRTSDTTLVFSGTSTAANDSQVEIRVDGVRVGKVTVTGGAWSYDYTGTALAEGSHTVRADLVDAAGNVAKSSLTQTVLIDISKPETPKILTFTSDVSGTPVAIGSATNDTTPTMTGTAEANALITIKNGAATVGTTQADGTGAWTFTPTTALPENNYVWSATATDAAGNDSVPTADRLFTVDITPPAFTTSGVTDNAAPITGTLAANASTNDTTPTLSGTADAGSLITVSNYGSPIGTTVADAAGKWSFTPTTALPEATYSLSAKAADALGNTTAESANYVFTVDVTPPDAPKIGSAEDNFGANTGSLASNATTDDNTPTLKGTAEAGSTVTIQDNGLDIGTTVAGPTGDWSFTPTTRPDGGHHFKAVATDKAGNTDGATSADFFLVIDAATATTPTVTGMRDDKGPITGAITDGSTTDDDTPIITGTAANAGDIIKVYDKGSFVGQTTADAFKNWTFVTPAASKLLEGNHAYSVTATNGAGSESSHTPDINFAVDLTPPVVKATVTAMSKDAGSSGTDFLTANWATNRGIYGTLTAGSLAAGEKLQISTDYGTTWLNAVVSGGNWTAVDNDGHFNNFEIWARVSDASGNANLATQAVTIDLVAPTDPSSVTLTGNQLVVALAGGVAVGDTASIAWGDHRIDHQITAADITAGSVSVTISAAYLAETPVPAYGASLIDAAGNVSKYVSGASGTVDVAVQHIDAASNAGYYADPSVTITNFVLDDVATYFSHANAGIHGVGFDTLTLTGAGQVLDLAAMTGFNNQGKIAGVESIDLTGTGNNTLKLSVNDVLNLGKAGAHIGDSISQMLIDGNAGDTVALSGLHDNGTSLGAWARSTANATVTVNSVLYDVYAHTAYSAEVLVQQGVFVQL